LRRILTRWRRSRPTLSNCEAYARWAASYPPYAHNALMRSEESLMRRHFPDFRGCVVLDLACGTGRYGLIAVEQGAARVIGCDTSPDMLTANPLPHRVLASSEAIPLPSGSIEIVLCGLALGHLPDPRPSLDEINRVLKPGGTALISDFHPALYQQGGRRSFQGSDGRSYHVEHYPHAPEAVRQAASLAGLQVIAVEEASVPGAPSPEPAVIIYQLRG